MTHLPLEELHRLLAGATLVSLAPRFVRFAPVRIGVLAFGCIVLGAFGFGCSGESAEKASATSRPAAEEVVRAAESGPLKVAIRADRNRVEVPEPVRLTIRVEAEKGIEVEVPKLEGLVGEFGVAEAAEAEVACREYAQCREWTYVLESYVPGAHEIPAMTFSYRDPREKADGSDEVFQEKLTTEPIAIEVTQALADIKGPVWLPMPLSRRVLWWALGVVGAMAAIGLAVRLWRRRRKRAESAPPEARITPHVWALRELDRLAAERLVERGLVQEFYYRVNGLVRRYIELRYGLMAGEQTSEEFIRALQYSAELAPRHKETLRAFVEACDPVKYARQVPAREEVDWVHGAARRFVVETAAADSAVVGEAPVRATAAESAEVAA